MQNRNFIAVLPDANPVPLHTYTLTHLHTKKGLTIIELVVVIVVLGLAVPPLLTMWANVAWRSSKAEALADATFYAQELMEEIKSKNFDENTSSPWTPSGSFGPDDGENSNNRATFDDVDDFVGCADTSVTAPAAGYTRSATVDYVSLSGCPSACTWAASGSADYKRISVTVARTDSVGTSASLTALVSAH